MLQHAKRHSSHGVRPEKFPEDSASDKCHFVLSYIRNKNCKQSVWSYFAQNEWWCRLHSFISFWGLYFW